MLEENCAWNCAVRITDRGRSAIYIYSQPLNTPKCSVRVFRVFMNAPPEYSDYSIEYSGFLFSFFILFQYQKGDTHGQYQGKRRARGEQHAHTTHT